MNTPVVRFRGATLLVAALLSACAGEPSTPIGFSLTDSGGIVIAVNHGSTHRAADVCVVSAEPVLDLGVVEEEGPFQFFRLFDVRELRDGRFAVVNQGSHEVRIFAPNGEFLQSFGGEGDGPGEFRSVRQVWELPGDSILVWDRRRQRLSIFDRAGEFGRSFQLQPTLLNPPDMIAVDRHFDILSRVRAFDPGFYEFKPQQLYLLRHDWDGRLIDTLNTYPNGSIGRIGPPEDFYVGSPFFEARTAVASVSGRILVSVGDRSEVQVLSPAFELERLIRWESGDLQVTEQHVSQLREQLLIRAGDDADSRRRVLNRFNDAPVEDRYPAVGDLRTSEDGRILVKRYPRPYDDDRQWLVFDSRGKFLCRLHLPSSVEVFQFGKSRITGMRRDQLDVEHVVVYEWSPE